MLTFGPVKKQGPKNDNMIIQNKGFVPMNEDVDMADEEEDIQPVIVGEDFGLQLRSEQERKLILMKGQAEKPSNQEGGLKNEKVTRRQHSSDES